MFCFSEDYFATIRRGCVPLDKAAQQAVERVPLDLRFLVLAVCHGLQKAAHAAHTVFALLDAVEILLGNRYGKDQSGCFPKNCRVIPSS